MLALLPTPGIRLLAEDEPPPEETWQMSLESSLQVYLESPDGTTDVPAGASRSAKATVELTTWEAWTSNLGNTMIQNTTTTRPSGASVTFWIAAGNGTSSTSYPVSTDSTGIAYGGITMGAENTRLQADASYGGITASATLDFSVFVPEVWTYNHSEGLLSVSISSPDGTSSVAYGATRTIQAHAQYDTWEVWTSDQGNTMTQNHASSPASGATVWWSVAAGGDGSVSEQSTTADSSGDASVTFIMGSSASTVNAYLSYAYSYNAEGAITFTPPEVIPENWEYLRTERTISVSMNPGGTTILLPPGTERTITTNVSYTLWDVWVETNSGAQDNRYAGSGVAENATVSFSIEAGGDGSVSSEYSSTDVNGNITANFVSGTVTSRVRADVSYLGGTAFATLDFSPESWEFVQAVNNVTMSFSSTNVGMSYESYEIWRNNATPPVNQNREYSSGPAIGAAISLSVSGDAQISPQSGFTDETGNLAVTVTPGGVNSTITASADFGGATRTATISVPFLDTDGDGYSDADELSQGTDPNDPSNNPGNPGGGGGKPTQIHNHNDEWVETVTVEYHNRETCVVTYEDSEGNETSASISVELGSQGKAAVAGSLGVSEEHVHTITISTGWVETGRTSAGVGRHPNEWMPSIPDGWDFDAWIVAPAEDPSPVVTTVTLWDDGSIRRIWTHTVGNWVAQWRIRMK